MTQGVYKTQKKDGSVYYRAGITFRNKHISLGSADDESSAAALYECAKKLLAWCEKDRSPYESASLRLFYAFSKFRPLSYDKIASIINFHDNGIYIGTPIYLLKDYFLYYLDDITELKFDTDDLFYYSSHRILRRGGHLYVNEYGMQTGILSRYGIRNHATAGVDYRFVNGDNTDYRYSNIENINPWHGVFTQNTDGRISYLAKIHVNGYWQIGIFSDPVTAAVAYNKAADTANAFGLDKNFPLNYIPDLRAEEYRKLYRSIKIPSKLQRYLRGE